jgi:hypothetical protein
LAYLTGHSGRRGGGLIICILGLKKCLTITTNRSRDRFSTRSRRNRSQDRISTRSRRNISRGGFKTRSRGL